MTTPLKPDFDLIDESLNQDRATSCKLTIQITGQSFSFTVLDPADQKYLALQSFRNPSVLLPGDFSHWLPSVVASSLLLSWKYDKTSVYVASRLYTLMPSPLFDPGQKERIMAFNLNVDPTSHVVLTDPVTALEAVTVYAVPLGLKDQLGQQWPGYTMHHSIRALIQGIMNRFKYTTEQGHIFVNILDGIFDVLIIQQQQVLFCNTFNYNAPEDILYYLIFVLEQKRMNPDQVNISIMGELGKHSAVIGHIRAYMPQITFLTRNDAFRYTHPFDDIPGHYFYNLLNTELCES